MVSSKRDQVRANKTHLCTLVRLHSRDGQLIFIPSPRRPWQLSVMRTSVALPPLQGKGAMRRQFKPHTFDQRLNEEKARIEAELEPTEPGPLRDLLTLKLRQVETAREIEDWLSSSRGLSQHEGHAGQPR